VKNYLIKQDLGERTMVVGICGDEDFLEKWDITSGNYLIRTGKFFRVSEVFAYFLTNKKRFEDALALMYFIDLNRKHEVPENGGRILAMQEARRDISNIRSENFYVETLKSLGLSESLNLAKGTPDLPY